jgi:V/A-type H+-transporting ATPase subunit I
MDKVRVVCLEKDRRAAVRILHKLGVIDLRRSKLTLQDVQQPEDLNEINELLIRVDGAIALLGKREVRKSKSVPLNELVERVKDSKAINEIYQLGDARRSLTDEGKLLDYAEYVATAFSGLKVNFSQLKTDALIVRGFSMPAKQLSDFMREFSSKTRNSELVFSRHGSSAVVIVAYDKKANIDDILKSYTLNEFDLESKYVRETPASILENVRRQRAMNAAEMSKINARLGHISDEQYSTLAGYSEMLNIELVRANASSYFKKTDSTFIVEGWVPEKSASLLRNTLTNGLSGRVTFDVIEENDELAPTLTNRPKFLRSFDYMVEFFSVPRSDEIDPTWIFILSFPIFYGLMISDVGYGIMSLILATLIKRKVDPDGLMYNVSTLWQINSVSAMFFGVLSNQYLGIPLNQYIVANYTGLNWFTDISFIAVISIVFGLAQVLLGLAFGFINDYNHHKKKLAYAKISSIILVISATIAIAGGLFGAFNSGIYLPSAAIAILSLLATLALSGEKALEVIDLISHTLSYMRIMGFGLASVIIAFLIDFAFTPKLSDGILLFIIYSVIFLLLHVLNMIVSIFEGLVQGLRLNFVEFFTKFYEGGGIKFKPFTYKRVHTEE